MSDDKPAENSTKNNDISSKPKEKTVKKEKPKFLSKVIVRRLPPTMSEEDFLQQVQPLPEHDAYYFVPADWSLGQDATSRAYIQFKNAEDVFIFKDRFDEYVFVDNRGVEYPAVVEFAPFQGIPRNKSRKKDPKCGTLESDPHFISFLDNLQNEENDILKPELKLEYSYQVKDDKKITSTPLLQYLANKKQERRDERKRKFDEKRKQREDDRQKKKQQIATSIPLAIKEEDAKDIGRTLDKEEKNSDKLNSRARRRAGREARRKQNRDENKNKSSQENPRNDSNKSIKENSEATEEETPEAVSSLDAPEDPVDNKESTSKTINIRKYSETRRDKRRQRTEDKKKERKELESVQTISISKTSRDSLKPENLLMKKISQNTSDDSAANTLSNEETSLEPADSLSNVKSPESNENVQEFIRNVSNIQEFVPHTPEIDSTSSDILDSSKEIVKKKINVSELQEKLENISITKEESSNLKVENSFEKLTEEQEEQQRMLAPRVRNKDRPSLEIYQPGKSRLSSRREDGRSSSELKDYKSNPTSDCESVKTSKDENVSLTPIRKKVHRYSEKRVNITKEMKMNAENTTQERNTKKECQ